MPDSVAHRDLLYETAISIGVAPDLRGMLRTVLQGMARRFGCILAAVVQADLSSGDEGLFRTEHIVPKALAGSEEYASMLERLPELLLDGGRSRLLIEENGSFRYVFRIGGFGFLLLVRSRPFDERFLLDFEPILGMLGGACSVGFEMERRIAAEQELRSRSELQRLLIDLSLDFINLPLGRLDPSIEKALGDMGRFVRADRAYLFAYDFERGVMSNTHEWCGPGIEPFIEELQDVPNAGFPDWVHSHRHGAAVHIPDVGALPQGPLRDILSSQGIRSLVTLPLGEGDGCLGYVGFDAVANRRVWTPDDIMLLRVFAQLLMNAELRRRREIEILEAHKEIDMAYRRLQQSAEKINSLALEAQSANIAKSRFLAIMSHELRTPLNAVLGMAALLRETRLDEAQLARLAVVEKAGTDLLRIIDDILDFSKVDDISFEKIEFPLRNIFDNAPFAKREALFGKFVAPSWKIAPDVPERIVGDPLRISRVFNNIVGNAIKFTPSGEIAVSVDVVRSGGRFLRFTVRDTGVGMSPEQMEQLFEPFVQGDTSGTRRYGGTGLGLPLSKKIVESMGGTFSAKSALGEGSVFEFTVPLELPPASSPGRRTSSSASLSGVRVLLAEDEVVSRALLQRILENLKASVSLARNGAEAVRAVEEEAFDCVLMDINMPVMGGYEAAGILRRMRPGLPILALSADEEKNAKAPALAAGMNDFLSKPVDPDALAAAIAGLVREACAPPGPDAARPCVDFGAGLRSTGGDALFYERMLSKFRASYAAADKEIAKALAGGNAVEARRIAHSVKGVAGNVGATQLQERAAALERAVADEAEPAEALAGFGEALADALEAIGKRLPPEDAPAVAPPSDGRPFVVLLTELEAALAARKPKPAKESLAALSALFPSGEKAEAVDGVKRFVDKYRFSEALAALKESALRRAAEKRGE